MEQIKLNIRRRPLLAWIEVGSFRESAEVARAVAMAREFHQWGTQNQLVVNMLFKANASEKYYISHLIYAGIPANWLGPGRSIVSLCGEAMRHPGGAFLADVWTAGYPSLDQMILDANCGFILLDLEDGYDGGWKLPDGRPWHEGDTAQWRQLADGFALLRNRIPDGTRLITRGPFILRPDNSQRLAQAYLWSRWACAMQATQPPGSFERIIQAANRRRTVSSLRLEMLETMTGADLDAHFCDGCAAMLYVGAAHTGESVARALGRVRAKEK